MLEDFAARSSILSRTRRLDEVAAEVLSRFGREAIGARALKGVALSRLLYREGEVRGYFDVDVIIAPEALERAGEVLTELGFQNLSALDGVVDVAGVLHAQMWSKAESAVGNVTVDLHWTLAGCSASPEAVWSAISADSQSLRIGGSEIPVLGFPALALHLALHAAHHGPEDVKAMGDLRRGIERWSPEVWQEAARLAESVGAPDWFAAGLRLTTEGTFLADGLLGLQPASLQLTEIELRSERPRGAFHVEALSGADAWRDRIRVVRHALFPSRRWIEREYRWAIGRSGLVIVSAYALHLLRSPKWAARAWRFRRQVMRRAESPQDHFVS